MANASGSPTIYPFPSTHWSAVVDAATQVAVSAAAEDGSPAAPPTVDALGRLLVRYLPALQSYLIVERRLNPGQAEDLLQAFVADRVLSHNLLARAEPQRGRFRTFLLACLDRYAAEQRRRDRATTRAPGSGQELLPWEDELAHPVTDPRESDVFEVAWARQVLGVAIDRMRRECEQAARPDLWGLFEFRILRAALDGAPPLGYAELVSRFGFTSVVQATNALVTAKRMFARLLRQTVAEYVPASEVEEELLGLRQALSRGHARLTEPGGEG